jgi:hypothetical protein
LCRLAGQDGRKSQSSSHPRCCISSMLAILSFHRCCSSARTFAAWAAAIMLCAMICCNCDPVDIPDNVKLF